mmetsp:Transcript_138/g.511  ORF Transcript_138/g.511 Transcript_138/m.511 type:complete len:317 (-) Transcript_138:2712-3662(-)
MSGVQVDDGEQARHVHREAVSRAERERGSPRVLLRVRRPPRRRTRAGDSPARGVERPAAAVKTRRRHSWRRHSWRRFRASVRRGGTLGRFGVESNLDGGYRRRRRRRLQPRGAPSNRRLRGLGQVVKLGDETGSRFRARFRVVVLGPPVRPRRADPRRAVVPRAVVPRRRGEARAHLRNRRRGIALHFRLERLRAQELELDAGLLGADGPARSFEQASRDAVRVLDAAEPELFHERPRLLRVEDHGQEERRGALVLGADAVEDRAVDGALELLVVSGAQPPVRWTRGRNSLRDSRVGRRELAVIRRAATGEPLRPS